MLRQILHGMAGIALVLGCTLGHAQQKLVVSPSAQASEQRVALVIGNSKYKDAPLTNPVNDARDVAKALSSLGFTVSLKENANQREMKQAIRDFAEKIRRGGIGLFYFAGHGIQSKGRNYIVPIDADIKQEYELEDQTVDMNLLLAAMDDAKNPVNIVILDACRNNPFARAFRSTASGLAPMDAAKGTLIAYATAPGSVAADGSGRNGTYTKHLLRSLQEPDSDATKVFSRVRAAVFRETNGRQVPWESTSLIGDFYFNTNQLNTTTSPPAREQGSISPLALEISYWESVQQSTNKADFEAYLNKHPDGLYATLAKNRIAALGRDPGMTATAKEGRSKVYFLRRGSWLAGAITISVTDKGRVIGNLPGPSASYFVYDAPAGDLLLSLEGHNGAAGIARAFTVAAGETYYIEASINFFSGAISIRVLDETEGSTQLQALNQSKR